jgi:hypothetical protein
MPFYPSSAVGGTSQGGYSINNLTSYQELKDITIGYGAGVNDTTTATFNSQAKYPTDVNFGGPWRTSATGPAIGSSSNQDLQLAMVNLAAAGLALTTAIYTTMSSQEQLIGPNYSVLSFNNLQSKLEKVTYEMNRLASDLSSLGNEASTANLQNTSGRRYPSSFNRFTNTAGGI